MDKSLDELKEEWIKGDEEQTGLPQPKAREKLNKIGSLAELKAYALEQAKYWKGQGVEWDHYFYTKFGQRAQHIADQIK